MASFTQTRRDSDAGETPGARTSLCAGETAHTIKRRRFAEFKDLFVGPVAALSTEQNLLVKRELLESLSRRSVYWMALLLVESPFWFVFGSWIKTSDIDPLFRVVWMLGLWGMVTPLAAYLLKKTMALPKHAGVSTVEQMHWAWIALVMLTSFWWAAASFGLNPPNFVVLHGFHFRLARYGFLELTMISQAFTLLLLAPSFRAALGSLVIGTIPFGFNIAPLLFINRPGMFDWYTAQIIGYGVIAWFICNDQQRTCVKAFPYTDRDRRVPVAKKPVYFQ